MQLVFEFLLLLGPSTWCLLAPTVRFGLWLKNCDIFPVCLAGTWPAYLLAHGWVVGQEALVPHWSALQRLSPGKNSTEGKLFEELLSLSFKASLVNPCLARNSNEALENSGICKLMCLWRTETLESKFSLYKGWLQLMGSDHSLLQKGGSLCLNGLAAIHIILLALQLQISIM